MKEWKGVLLIRTPFHILAQIYFLSTGFTAGLCPKIGEQITQFALLFLSRVFCMRPFPQLAPVFFGRFHVVVFGGGREGLESQVAVGFAAETR